MRENQRIGRPLRTDPEDFPERFPLPTRNLYAELNKLIGEAGLTHKGIAELVASELNQTIKQIVRQLGETHSGPTRELFEAVIATAAGSLGESAPHLLAVYLPLWERAQPDTRGSKPAKPAPKSTAPTAGFQRPIRVKAIKKPNLAEKTARLLNLLVDGKEADAAAQLNSEFGRDTSMLVAALTEVGRLVPETVAALLHAVREREGESRSTALLAAIRNLDGDVAERIIAVPRHDEPAPAQEPDILKIDPILLFGRHTASLIRRGDIGQACREVAAKFSVPADGPENPLDAINGKATDGPTAKVGVPVGGQEDILGAIIGSADDGSELVSMLLSAMVESHREQMLLCVAEFLRGAQSADADDTLRGITGALSADLRETIVMLSRKSQVPSSPGPVGDVFDAFFAKAETLSGAERLITTPTEPQTITRQSHTTHIPARQLAPTEPTDAAGTPRTSREPEHPPPTMHREPPGLPPWLAESETSAELATSATDPHNAPPWLSAPQPSPQQAPEPPIVKVLLPPLKSSKTSPRRPAGSTSPIVEQGRPGYRNRYTDPEPIVYEDASPRSYVKRGPRTQTADSLRAPFDCGPAPLVSVHIVEEWVERPRFPRASVDGPSDTPYPTTPEPEKPPTEPVL